MPDLSLSQRLFLASEYECKNADDCDTSMMDIDDSSVVSVEGICIVGMFHQ